MIRFSSEAIPMPSLDYDLVKQWIIAVADSHGFDTGNLSYLFCNDEYMLEVNRKYLGHDYYTDIITFDYSVGESRDDKGTVLHRGRVSGDMYISLDTVASNADKFGCSPSDELLRVIIHGVLHLTGINDKAPGEREIMEANENEALALFNSLLITNQLK